MSLVERLLYDCDYVYIAFLLSKKRCSSCYTIVILHNRPYIIMCNQRDMHGWALSGLLCSFGPLQLTESNATNI